MDGKVLTVFLIGTFLGGLTSGLAGFAMGLVVSGIWLHVITPLQTATPIVGFGFVTQSYAIWKLRGALDWRAAAPFILGGAFGVPVGTMLLTYVDPATVRNVGGGLLIAYSAYGLARPRFKPLATNRRRDLAIGGLNGLLGGITGLTGIIATIWCQLIGLYGKLDDAGFPQSDPAVAACLRHRVARAACISAHPILTTKYSPRSTKSATSFTQVGAAEIGSSCAAP